MRRSELDQKVPHVLFVCEAELPWQSGIVAGKALEG